MPMLLFCLKNEDWIFLSFNSFTFYMAYCTIEDRTYSKNGETGNVKIYIKINF